MFTWKQKNNLFRLEIMSNSNILIFGIYRKQTHTEYYRVRSVSIGTGSKKQNLLQVSLQLLNNLQNTFLLHRWT